MMIFTIQSERSRPDTRRFIAASFRLPQQALRSAAGVLREWRRRSRDRAQLAVLDHRMLRDIGVSRGDILGEINKPFWRR